MGLKPIAIKKAHLSMVLKRGYRYSDGFETHRYDETRPNDTNGYNIKSHKSLSLPP